MPRVQVDAEETLLASPSMSQLLYLPGRCLKLTLKKLNKQKEKEENCSHNNQKIKVTKQNIKCTNLSIFTLREIMQKYIAKKNSPPQTDPKKKWEGNNIRKRETHNKQNCQ